MFPERAKPARLSNDNCCYSNRDIAAIHAKQIPELAWQDYEALFALSRCTLGYDEQLYYLPSALEFLQTHPGEGNEFTAGLLYFLGSNQQRLAEDGFLQPAIEALRAAFARWTATFTVIRLPHITYVEHADSVDELLEKLDAYELGWLAKELVGSWLSPGRSPEAAAWLLAYANVSGTATLSDAALQKAYDEIGDTIVPATAAPEFWRNLVTRLGLTEHS